MNHRQRLQNCLAGTKVDRPPVALWRHFPVEDQSPPLLAKATARFQNEFDFDLVKVTPASSFCLKDWGLQDAWKGNPEGTREITQHVVKAPEDWRKLTPLNIKNNFLSAQLECLKLLKHALPQDTPVIQTVFNPLAQAKSLVGKNNLATHLRLYPDEVKFGLSVITETTVNFLESLAPLGIDGIFYAVQHAQADWLTRSEFTEFSRKYDEEILSYAAPYWLNMLHVHGEKIYFDAVGDYTCQVFNWHDQHTQPDLFTAQGLIPGVVCGGLRQWETLVNGTPESVQQEASVALESTNQERFILGTGCVLPITAPHCNILAARNAVEKENAQWHSQG